MCQVTSVDQYITTANEAAPPVDVDDTKSLAKSSERSDGLRVLICSESVPPQVNGIARRVGMYADGLRNLGCDVGERNIHRGNSTRQAPILNVLVHRSLYQMSCIQTPGPRKCSHT
jgi:hypothetical protein